MIKPVRPNNLCYCDKYIIHQFKTLFYFSLLWDIKRNIFQGNVVKGHIRYEYPSSNKRLSQNL